jgi:hypothetical protein
MICAPPLLCVLSPQIWTFPCSRITSVTSTFPPFPHDFTDVISSSGTASSIHLWGTSPRADDRIGDRTHCTSSDIAAPNCLDRSAMGTIRGDTRQLKTSYTRSRCRGKSLIRLLTRDVTRQTMDQILIRYHHRPCTFGERIVHEIFTGWQPSRRSDRHHKRD